MIEDTPIVEIFAVVVMFLCGRSRSETQLACAFVILIESITTYTNANLDIYFNYLAILYAYITVLFARMAHKSSLASAYAYTSYVIAYFLFAMEDTAMEWGVILDDGVLYGNYSAIMYGCLAVLVFAVTYDRMGTIRLRADGYMS
tara:strand:- start:22705 stop:23139 length:435 start_codon:yes stop_codon:yes gene_type:complete